MLCCTGAARGACSEWTLPHAADDDEDEDGDEEDAEDEDEDAEDAAAQEARRGSHAQAGPNEAGAAGGKPAAFFAQTPDGTRFAAGSFADLHLSRPLLRACSALGYGAPTPIQVLPYLGMQPR